MESPLDDGHKRGPLDSGDEWAVSEKISHPPLVDDATFRMVQGMRAARQTQDGVTKTYLLVGLVVCRTCGRRMDSHWVNNRPGYRCRHGHTSARNRPLGLAKNIYVREDRLLTGLRSRLSEVAGHDDSALADYLRTNELRIICAGQNWTIEAGAHSRALPVRRASSDRQLALPLN